MNPGSGTAFPNQSTDPARSLTVYLGAQGALQDTKHSQRLCRTCGSVNTPIDAREEQVERLAAM